ncbi:MAG: inorganic phosphate transporter, partial [Chloroflexota bacterium]
QILVFCIVGTALAHGTPINWATIWRLAIAWVLAPPAAFALGFLATKLLDRIVPEARLAQASRQVTLLPKLLVLVGLGASFVLGANDVSNAVGVWGSVHLTAVLLAGFAGGLFMALGALTWGQRILNRVAFDIVKMDLAMASAAQFVQALVVILAVTQGLFTSMNQALVGGMAGAGFARGKETVQTSTVFGILKGWAISPITGASLCFVLYKLLALLGAH